MGEQLAEHRRALYSVQERMQKLEDTTRSMGSSAELESENHLRRFESTDRSLISIRRLGDQIVSHLNAFPGKIQGLLQAILQSNIKSYQMLLKLQKDIPPRPTNILESNIRFEDALGEVRYLPYEYFQHWEVRFFAAVTASVHL